MKDSLHLLIIASIMFKYTFWFHIGTPLPSVIKQILTSLKYFIKKRKAGLIFSIELFVSKLRLVSNDSNKENLYTQI